jgi:hypothetical protein
VSVERLRVSLVIAGVILVAVFGLIQVAESQGRIQPNGYEVIQREREGNSVRLIAAPPGADEAPSIGFIESPTPYCFQPDPTQDECFINWRSISVEAAPTSMRVMTVTLHAVGPVARYQGYFQDSLYVSYDMHGKGFRVPCGSPGAGGEPQLGIGYNWTIEAEDYGDSSTSNFGTVYCPPFAP